MPEVRHHTRSRAPPNYLILRKVIHEACVCVCVRACVQSACVCVYVLVCVWGGDQECCCMHICVLILLHSAYVSSYYSIFVLVLLHTATATATQTHAPRPLLTCRDHHSDDLRRRRHSGRLLLLPSLRILNTGRRLLKRRYSVNLIV